MHGDKDIEGFLGVLPIQKRDQVFVAPAESPKACSAEVLAQALSARRHAYVLQCESVVAACERAAQASTGETRVVVTGSFNTAGPARKWLRH